jgi:acyl-CoA dehydrogenase family protein 10
MPQREDEMLHCQFVPFFGSRSEVMSVPGVGPVRKGHELNVSALEGYFKQQIDGFGSKIVEIGQFKSGQSNPTFYIKDDRNNEYVLRKKPSGHILPSAHAIEREYQVMKALQGSEVPVAEVLNLCVGTGTDIIGTPFYVMRYVRGRMFANPLLPEMSSKERSAIYNEMARVMAAIHSVDLESTGLASFGQSKGFIARQIDRWHSQYQKSKTHDIDAMDKVVKWLKDKIPQKDDANKSLIHGDFRIDNMIWHEKEARVVAVLDWELSTIGNPYSDVAYNCMPYIMPNIGRAASAYSGFGSDFDFKSQGIPDLQTYLSWYYQHRSCPPIDNFLFYQVFSLFRAASILQGVFKRSQQGNASAADASQIGAYAEHLADLAWTLASSGSSNGVGFIPSPVSSAAHSSTTASAASSSSSSSSSSVSANSDSDEALESMFHFSPKYYELKQKLLKFMEEEIYPREKEYEAFEATLDGHWTKWRAIPFMEELKAKAKSLGLWNMWIPRTAEGGEHGAGLKNVEYAPLCAILGRSPMLAPEATNCAAPDTGNMEVLLKYGSAEQKKEWLEPLLKGEMRSAFAMTEPAVASSDATNITTEIKRVGDDYIINGRKWWTSGAGRPECKVLIVMGKTNPSAPSHQQQSMILVPTNTPGVKIVRALPIFGYYDAPEGHMEVLFENVKVPAKNLIVGEGKGFEIAQGRLGPGRIHHCMRLVGIAERCLEQGIKRALSRTAFKRPIAFHGMAMNAIALSRIEIEQCRLLTYKAAYAMDTIGNKKAKDLIAMIKIVAPTMACTVIDRVIQLYGAAGLSNDFFVARAYANCRTLRLADGPDEVHIAQLARLEYQKLAPRAKL